MHQFRACVMCRDDPDECTGVIGTQRLLITWLAHNQHRALRSMFVRGTGTWGRFQLWLGQVNSRGFPTRQPPFAG